MSITELFSRNALAARTLELELGMAGRGTSILITAVVAINKAIAALPRLETRRRVATLEEVPARLALAVILVALVVAIKVPIAALVERNAKPVATTPLVELEARRLVAFFDALVDHGRRRATARTQWPAQLIGPRTMAATAARVFLFLDLQTSRLVVISTIEIVLQNADLRTEHKEHSQLDTRPLINHQPQQLINSKDSSPPRLPGIFLANCNRIP